MRRALRLFLASLRVLLRGFGWTFAVVVLLAAGVFFYLRQRFGPEEVRVFAVAQMQNALNRDVSIERVILAPRGFRVKGFRVRQNPLAGGGDLFSCDSAIVTVKLKPLLLGRIVFDVVRLESPRIELIRSAEGQWNIADLFVSSRATRAGTLPVALAAAETIVERGVLHVSDFMHGRDVTFDNLSLSADKLSMHQPFPLNVSFISSVVVSSHPVVARVSGQGDVDLFHLNWSSATLRIKHWSIDVDGVSAEGNATVDGFIRPVVGLSAAVSSIPSVSWMRWFGRSWRLAMPATKWESHFVWTRPQALEVDRLVVDTPAGSATASGLFDLGAGSETVRAVISVANAALEKSAAWHPAWLAREPRGVARMKATVSGDARSLQIKDLELSVRDFGMSWPGRRVENLNMDFSAAQEFARLNVTVTKGRIKAYDNSFEDLTASMTVSNQKLSVDSLTASWGGSRLRLRGRVDRLSAPREVLLSGSIDKLSWEDTQALIVGIAASISTRTAAAETGRMPWVRTFKYAIPRRFPDTAGHLRIGEVKQQNFWCRDVDLLWTFKGVTPDLNRVDGEARIRFGPGRVADIPAVQGAHTFLRVIFLPFVYMHKMNNLSVFSTATAYPKTLDFRKIEAEYGIARGVVDARYFHVDSDQLVAFAAGQADFGKEKVDMNILTRLTSARSALPDWWVDTEGRAAIGFRVTGDLNMPDLEPRFKKMGSSEIENIFGESKARGQKRFEALEKLRTL